jgi:pyridoxamine 5'-phosphate oxidase
MTDNKPYNLFTEITNYEMNKPGSDKHDIFCATLSTIQPDNKPYSRTVFIIDIMDEKFKFITSIFSSKCGDIKYNNNVSLLFRWKTTQVIISGKAYVCSNDINNKYWNKRTINQQQASWEKYTSLKYITNKYNTEISKVHYTKESRVPDINLPRVPSWGVVEIIPFSYDFTIDNEYNNKKRMHFELKMMTREWIKSPDKFTVIIEEE